MALERNYRFQIAEESTYGDGGSSFADIPVLIESLPVISFTEHEQLFANGTLARNQSIMGVGQMEFPVKFFLKGQGTAGSEPEYGMLLRAFGLTAESTASVSASFYTNDTVANHQSYGVRVNLDGVRYATSGVRASTLVIPLVAGEPVLCEMNLNALYTEPVAGAYAAPSYSDSTVAPIVQEIAMTIGGNTHSIKNITFNLENMLLPQMSINAANRGISSFDITGRNFGGSMLVAVDSNNDIEWFTNLRDNTEVAVVSASAGFGSTTGNRISLSAGKVQFTNVAPVVEDERQYYQVDFRINKSSSNQTEFAILYS